MSNKFIIASFFTKGTAYEKIAKKYLIASCERFNMHPIIVELTNYKNWYRNVAEKPRAILELLENSIPQDTCLVFLDADATIERYPKLFEEIPERYDIGYHILDWNLWYGYTHVVPIKELLTGTMFFRNNDKVKALCSEWHETAVRTSEWEQKVLQRIIRSHDVKIYELPLSYCYMNSTPKGEPIVKLNPVILHWQVSRTMKLKKRLY